MQSNMEHIKITDLSIGDWISINGEPRKINSINGISGIVSFNGLGNYYGTGVIEPIPITTELIMKNNLDAELIINDANKCCTHIDVMCNRIKIKKRDRVLLNARVEYVHELQHFLHIVGVDKEITL